MKTLEIVTNTSSAEVPILDSPDELLNGLSDIVGGGTNTIYNDVAWARYVDTIEEMETSTNPYLQAILDNVDPARELMSLKITQHPNIALDCDRLARNMVLMKESDGFFWRIDHLDQQRLVVMPAQHAHRNDKAGQSIEVDLSHGITFDGKSLVSALFNKGYPAEIIDYRDEPDFPAYRETTLGQFFVRQALKL